MKSRVNTLLMLAGIAMAAGIAPVSAQPVLPNGLPSAVPSPIMPALQLVKPASHSPITTFASGGAGTQLAGLFRITGASCSGTPVTGSYFRMIQSGGSSSGPYVSNTDSSCQDNTYTPMNPGTDGGLSTLAYQPNPNPAFDSVGGGTAGKITKPVKFFGVNFAVSTNSLDPQTNTKVSLPSLAADSSGKISGDLRAFSAAWNHAHFNQGSPKPDGSKPGITSGPSGTYDAATGHYAVDWRSQIVGGAFNNFIGVWHLEGTFVANAGPRGATGSSGSGAGGSQVSGVTARIPRTGVAVQTLAGLAVLSVALGLALRRGSRNPRLPFTR